ncbi:hypothetical protein Leryth_025357 [Lithospermum erythrorhizon]|nr:hypothetical protein Leryth_025357 [Lithospermum erythrorhizon]
MFLALDYYNMSCVKTTSSPFLNGILNHQPTTSYPPESTSLKATTTTILNLLRLGRLSKAISILFSTPFSFPFSFYTHLLHLCSASKSVIEVRKLESHLVSFNPTPPVFVLNRAIEAYGKCGYVVDARELFDEMPQRDGGSWNAVITAYSRNGFYDEAIGVFLDMHRAGVFGSEVTFASVLGSCGSLLELWLARQVHGLVLKYGFCGNVILESSLVDIYGKCGVMSEARRMFDGIENPNVVSWNVIVRRYLESGQDEAAVSMFFKMIGMNMIPLNFTVSSAIVACSKFRGIKEGMQIHGYVIKSNMVADEVVCSSLIDMFVKCGDMSSAHSIFDLPSSKNLINYTSMVSGYAMSGRPEKAKELFDEMPERNVISWNSMLAGYTRLSQWDDALNFFIMMNNEFGYIDYLSLGLILNVCAALSDVQLGKQVHGYIYRHGLNTNSFVGNALLDMYGKWCWHKKSALEVG